MDAAVRASAGSAHDRLHQVAGDDFSDITGQWRISPAAGGCEILFEATYDLGVPIYDRIVDPLVEKVLADHVRAIIDKL